MRRLIVLGLAALAVAGCSDPAEPAAAPTTGPSRSATPTGTTTTPARSGTPAPRPTATRPAVTVEGPCPYAGADAVADIVGQRIARTTVTRTTPHPGCAFHRSNAEKAAEVAVSVLADAATARARVLAVAGPAANPVRLADGGAVAITDDGAVLAVSAGPTLVVVRINQRISLEAVEIAKLVLAEV